MKRISNRCENPNCGVRMDYGRKPLFCSEHCRGEAAFEAATGDTLADKIYGAAKSVDYHQEKTGEKQKLHLFLTRMKETGWPLDMIHFHHSYQRQGLKWPNPDSPVSLQSGDGEIEMPEGPETTLPEIIRKMEILRAEIERLDNLAKGMRKHVVQTYRKDSRGKFKGPWGQKRLNLLARHFAKEHAKESQTTDNPNT